MKRAIKKSMALLILALFAAQFSLISTASAAPGSAEIRMEGFFSYLGKGGITNTCNDGDEDVISFKLQSNTTGADVDEFLITKDTNVTNPNPLGSVDSNGVWTGTLSQGECVSIVVTLIPNVAIGDDFTVIFEVTDVVLAGDLPNSGELNLSNNSKNYGTFTNALMPDLTNTPRLLTSGTITNGTALTYEVKISNIGEGVQLASESMSLGFYIPSNALYDEVIDPDTNDNFNIDFCASLGDPINVGEGLGSYSGVVAYCNITPTVDMQPGDSFILHVKMNAVGAFNSNVAVISFITGNDVDSLLFQTELIRGGDAFNLLTNNRGILEYNPAELQTTINRCSGFNATVSSATGCFRVTFNKLIYAPSFTVDDLVLTGGGSISGFTRIDDYTWEVNVSGLTLNTTTSLSLDPESVQDYNAFLNGVQVLGENTIRYELPSANNGNSSSTGGASGTTNSTSANGVLANTGTDPDYTTPILLLILGAALLILSRKREKTAAK